MHIIPAIVGLKNIMRHTMSGSDYHQKYNTMIGKKRYYIR
jgi:hypothetical protein